MNTQQLWIASIGLGALGLVLWASTLVWRLWRSARASSQVARILQARDSASTTKAATKSAMQANDAQLLNPLSINVRSSDSPQAVAANLPPPAWLQWGVAKALLADEDRKLLDQAGVGTRNGSMAYVPAAWCCAWSCPCWRWVCCAPARTLRWSTALWQ
jgi:tight adherence protein C